MADSLSDLLWEDASWEVGLIPGDFLDGRRVLVTGGTGLIGTHFLVGLLYLKHNKKTDIEIEVISKSPISAHVTRLPGGNSIQSVALDLSRTSLPQGTKGYDVILHAATYAQPSLFTADPIGTIRLNTTTLFDLFGALAPEGRILFLSSSEIYSGCTEFPCTEDHIGRTSPSHPRASYIEGKRAGEAICHAFSSEGFVPKVARLSLAYGTGSKWSDQRVLNAFIRNAITQGEIRIMDSGSAFRTYCYVSDAVEMMWKVLSASMRMVYNVCGVSSVSIRELAELIGNKMKVPVYVSGTPDSLMSGSPNAVSLDNSLLLSEIGKKSFVPLEQGLDRTIAWYKMLGSMSSSERY